MSVGLRVELVAFDAARHDPLLVAWLKQPHVARWFGAGVATLEYARHPPPGAHQAIIAVNGEPAGYIRWQAVSRAVLDSLGLPEIPEGSVDIDLFIGDPRRLGKRVGPEALAVLLERLRTGTNAPLAGLTTSIENDAAARSFERAGFRRLLRYDPPGFGPCWLLVHDLRSPA